ncbi:MAG TPA: D-2-hydroxyacid dehydrogenase [Dehalococcoidia bacterium]|nr:D-2-hydroxyacid dehydrogenase [Dehalococcoidia bacterium]
MLRGGREPRLFIIDAEVTMEPISLVITSAVPVPPAALAQIQAVDARLQIAVIPEAQRPFLRTGKGGDPASEARALANTLSKAEILFSAYELPADLLRRAPRLKWVHIVAAGVERWVGAGFLEQDGLIFTSGQGPTAQPIAEYILMTMLMLAKNAPSYVRQQEGRQWQGHGGAEVNGKTLGIVGLGTIGSAAARLAKAVGCRVVAVRRSVQEARENVEGVDRLLPARELPRLLAESDFVALCAPSTPETKHLIDAAALRRMKPSAFLINIARGSLIDEAALVAALKDGEIAGAALDVFEPEPLSPESELWGLPNVLITPHVSNASERFARRASELFIDNLGRYLRGEPLRNVVSREKGY